MEQHLNELDDLIHPADRKFLRKAKRLVAKKPFTPRPCFNCSKPTTHPRGLFCSERCRQIGELMRWGRRKIKENTFDRPDVVLAFEARRSQLVFGFYDKRARKVSDETRQQLLLRSKGRCERCQRKFTDDRLRQFTVQHTKDDQGLRLEAWCWSCNMDHALGTVVPLTPEEAEFVRLFDARLYSSDPILPCDDEVRWPQIFRELQGSRA
jgi:endogenous inhibitor of DNA gyrase (YacG/DUF329 family)